MWLAKEGDIPLLFERLTVDQFHRGDVSKDSRIHGFFFKGSIPSHQWIIGQDVIGFKDLVTPSIEDFEVKNSLHPLVCEDGDVVIDTIIIWREYIGYPKLGININRNQEVILGKTATSIYSGRDDLTLY